MTKKNIPEPLKVGDIVISKNLDALFKVLTIEENQIAGFNILADSKMASIPLTAAMKITHDMPLIRQLVSNEFIRIDLSNLFFTSVDKKAAWLNISARTMFRSNNVKNV